MKRHLNTLFISTQGAYLSAQRKTVVVTIDKEVRLRVPLHMLEGIVTFGRVSLSPFLMGRCSEHGIGISFLTQRGRFLARVQGPVSGNVLLRREQYRRADDLEFCSGVARVIIAAKTANARAVLQRAARDHPGKARTGRVRDCVRLIAERLSTLHSGLRLETLRGFEGELARSYFGVFDDLILHRKEHFFFDGRSRRPPTDAVNAMLSFVYTLLTHDMCSALESVGLDPQVGFLHRDRPGRPGLALDLIEEFRAFVADRLVLSVINRRQVQPTGFHESETGAVQMTDSTRKAVLVAYQERKQETICHPFLNEKTTVGMLIHLQALIFARFLRGDLDGYPPFISK